MKSAKGVASFLIKDVVLNRFYIKVVFLIMTLLTSVPFIHNVLGSYTKLLLAWGFVIIVYDFFTKRLFLKNKYSLILLLFLVLYAITILIGDRAMLWGNISQWCYMAVFFFVFLPVDSDMPERKVKSELSVLFNIFVCITFVFSVYCFATFCIWYSQTYTAINEVKVYLGVVDGRLWGLYNPNAGGMLNLISIALSMFFVFTVKKKGLKILYIINSVLQLFCLVLTQSRSSFYAMIVFAIIFCFFTAGKWAKEMTQILFKKDRFKTQLKIAARLFMTVLVTVILVYSYEPIRQSLQAIPNTISSFFQSPDPGNDTEEEDKTIGRFEVEENRPGGFLTGRTDLWRGGWQVFKNNPVMGVSYESIAKETEPYVDKMWHTTLNKGRLHNIYITILVASGSTGFIVLAVFALLSAIKLFRGAVETMKKPNLYFIIIIGLIVSNYVAEMVEARILYNVSVFSVFFWIIYGYGMYFAEKSIKNKKTADISGAPGTVDIKAKEL